MSYLTGKADFLDFYDMSSNKKDFIKNLSLYVDNVKVAVNDEVDLIPYYPFLISSSCSTPQSNVINLSKRPYIDVLESAMMSSIIHMCIKCAKKYKNDKSKILVDHNFTYYLNSHPEAIFILDIILENKLANKVPLFRGDSYTFDRYCDKWLIPEYFSDIRLHSANYARQEWLELAKNNNYAVSIYDANKNEFIKYNENGLYSKVINDAALKIYFYVNFLKRENSLKMLSI